MSPKIAENGLFQKKKQTGSGEGWWYTFENTPKTFKLFTLPLEIPGKTRPHQQKLHKIVLHPSEILRP